MDKRNGSIRGLHMTTEIAPKRMAGQPIYYGGQPKEVRVTRFVPELNRAREYGWIEQGQSSPFITCEALVSRIVIQFVDLAEKAELTPAGKPLSNTASNARTF